MPKPWAEVAASPQYQALPPDQKEAARVQYFQQVVAPQLPDAAQLREARAQFDKATAGPWQPTQRTPQMLAQHAAEYRDQHPVTDDMSTGGKMVAGVGKSLMDTFHGLQQVGGEIGMRAAPDYVAPKLAQVQDTVDESRRIDSALMNTKAGIGGNVIGVGAQMFAPGADAGQLVTLPGKAGALLRGAVSGGAFAATQPVATGETRVGNAATGAAFGALGQGVASAAGKVGSAAWGRLSPEVQRLAGLAKQAGIPVHFSQLSDSKFVKTLASTLSYLPFSGGAAKAKAQQEAFNAAAGRGFFAQDAKHLTDDVMHTAKDRMGAVYDKIFQGRPIALDNQALKQLFALHAQAGNKLESEQAKVARAQIERILDESAAHNGAMPGEIYQSLRGELKKDFPGSDRLDSVVKEARKIMDESAARSLGPAAAKALAKVNAGYANFKTVESVLKQVAGAKGDIKPSALWPAVRNGSTKEMRELAKIGQMLKDPIPDSGTTGRALAAGLGTGGLAFGGVGGLALLAKLGLVGATVGRAANSETAAHALASGVPQRGLQALARGVEKTHPEKLLPAATVVGLNQRKPKKPSR